MQNDPRDLFRGDVVGRNGQIGQLAIEIGPLFKNGANFVFWRELG